MTDKFLAFKIKDTAYCVPILDSKEIKKVSVDELYYDSGEVKPMVRDALGELVALHDMHYALLGVPSTLNDEDECYVIFMHCPKGEKAAFAVDELIGIIQTETHEQIEAPALVASKGWVTNILSNKTTGSLVSILNWSAVLQSQFTSDEAA